MNEEHEIVRYQRYRGYDYSRGAVLFITIVTEPRRAHFGVVRNAAVELSPLGREVERVLGSQDGEARGLGAQKGGMAIYWLPEGPKILKQGEIQ